MYPFHDHSESQLRICRDTAVNSVMSSHAEFISKSEFDRRNINELLSLACQLALTQFRAMHEMEMAEIMSYRKMRAELAYHTPPSMPVIPKD